MHPTAVTTTQVGQRDLEIARVGLLGVGLMGSRRARLGQHPPGRGR
jgi:hypothetical protein